MGSTQRCGRRRTCAFLLIATSLDTYPDSGRAKQAEHKPHFGSEREIREQADEDAQAEPNGATDYESASHDYPLSRLSSSMPMKSAITSSLTIVAFPDPSCATTAPSAKSEPPTVNAAADTQLARLSRLAISAGVASTDCAL